MSQVMFEDTVTLVAKIVPPPEERSEEKAISHFGNAKDILIYMADDSDAPPEDSKGHR